MIVREIERVGSDQVSKIGALHECLSVHLLGGEKVPRYYRGL